MVNYNNILKSKLLINKEGAFLSTHSVVEVANFHQHKKGREEVSKTLHIYKRV